VIHLLHGLAENREGLAALKRPIELLLVDPDRERTDEMVRYARIVARKTGLPLAPAWTDDRAAALAGADWVLLSVGLWKRLRYAEERFGRTVDGALDSGRRNRGNERRLAPCFLHLRNRPIQRRPDSLLDQALDKLLDRLQTANRLRFLRLYARLLRRLPCARDESRQRYEPASIACGLGRL
jgi:hypothetical protein